MTRRTPLKRKSRLRQKRARPRRSGRVRDRDYLLRVKGLPCCLPGILFTIAEGFYARSMADREHEGEVEADHAGPRPVGRKADDSTAIPLCRKHHRQRTDYTGIFRSFDAYHMRDWCDLRIAETRAALGWSGEAA